MHTSVKTIAPTGRIVVALPCVKCGHLLKGQSISGVCPECAEPIHSTLSARSLANLDYARGGLEDYGLSLKISTIALLGILLMPVLGPLSSVVVAAAGIVRVSATGRLLRSGLGIGHRSRSTIALSHWMAWIATVTGSLATIVLLHDALGRWSQWLTGPQAAAMVAVWMFMILLEWIIASRFLFQAASVVEVGWYSVLARLAITGLAFGVLLQILFSTVGGNFTGPVAIMARVVFVWAPVITGGLVLGSLIQQLGSVAQELHAAASGVSADEE